MKYRVNYDEDKEFTLSGKDIHSIIDKCEEKGRSINWLKDDDGTVLAERLTPTVTTTKNKLKLR
jgi:hypothetical protein